MKTDFLTNCYPSFEKELLQEIEAHSVLKEFVAGESIIKQAQYVKFLPIIQSGCAKVFCNEGEKDFLLYFIETGEPCIYSFAHIDDNYTQAEFSADAELDSTLLLLPIDRVRIWIKNYNSLNQIILKSYQKHYYDLLDTTKQMICYNLEDRLLEYLKQKSEILGVKLLSISHQEIARDLGTSREVISRLLKSKKSINSIKQEGHKIKIL